MANLKREPMADPITLHTKYRPTKFSDVIGQDHFIKQLGDITSDRTSQAYLFHGPAGCGKTTLARICARKLGCKPSDIIEHDGATKNGVEEMRNLQTAVRYKPIGGGSVRAVILDEVHRVTGQAFDSILKIVEEPPPHLFWLFCTTAPTKVPNTIRQRCQTFALREVSPEHLAKLLRGVAKAEKLSTTDEVIDYIASKSFGSPRQALVNLERCAEITSKREAASALEQIVNEDNVLALCRYLVGGKRTWPKAMELVKAIGEPNMEGVRILIANYVAGCLKNALNDDEAVKFLPILEAFSTPFPVGEGSPALMLAIGRALYAET